MKVTATQLRSELYQILDRVLETGEAVQVTRSHGTLVIKPLFSEEEDEAPTHKTQVKPQAGRR